MKDFMTVFKTGFKYCYNDWMSMIILTIFPIVLIFVLGNALAGFIEPNYDFGGERLPLAAVAEETGALGAFLQSDDVSWFLSVTFTDEKTAGEMLEAGDVFLIILEKDGEISVIRTLVSNINTAIALSVVDLYMQIGAAMESALMRSEGVNFAELMQVMEAEIAVIDAPLGTRVQSAIDYYAVTMLVMILMFTGMNGLELFKKGIFSGTGARVLISPVSKPALIGGLLAAATVLSYLQGMITFLFTWIIYGVYWGDNIPLVLLTLFGVTLFSQAFAITLLLLFKNNNATQAAMQALIWVMTFVAGGYVKVSFGAADAIFRYSPNSLAHTIIFGSAFGGNHERMMNDLMLLFIYGGVLFVIAFLLGKRRLT
jgi:ABC-2 type transport system permease protein